MNIKDTILRQYGNSSALKSIIYSFNERMKVDTTIDKLYANYFNLDTANSSGLDCWGNIVRASRFVKFSVVTNDVLGFYSQNLQTLNNGSFYSGKKSTQTLRLSDDFYRKVIKVKAVANISDVTIRGLNRLLVRLFRDSGKPFVTDNQDMSINYVFPFYLKDNEKALIQDSSIIPRPSGVKLRAIITTPSKTFGFFGSGCQTFNNGAFLDKKGIFYVN